MPSAAAAEPSADPNGTGSLLVINSLFENNGVASGSESGFDHALYATQLASVTVENSNFQGTQVGHDIKSRAATTVITGNTLDDGVTGTTNLLRMDAADPTSTMLKLGLALILIGLGFKVAAAPFQIWTPDVYEGAPTPVTALFSAGPKAAAFRRTVVYKAPPETIVAFIIMCSEPPSCRAIVNRWNQVYRPASAIASAMGRALGRPSG